MNLWVLWLCVILFLSIAEISTLNLVSIWFVLSGLVSLIVSFFIEDFFIQFAIFVILGILLLLTTRKIVEKALKPKIEKTNLDRVIGMTAVVTEPIKKNSVGEVKVDGKRWSAIAESEFNKEDEVIVEKIDGVKLMVRKKEV